MADFQKIVQNLIEAGLSEAKIAEAAGVSQPTINRVKSGKQKNISYALGAKLIALNAQQGVEA